MRYLLLSIAVVGLTVSLSSRFQQSPSTEIASANRPTAAPTLRLEEYGADSTGFHVVATLIAGPTEGILWDGQYHLGAARRAADRIAATGVKLKAIVLSHADHDHFMGVAAILERFPHTPVYLTAAALDQFNRTAQKELQQEKSSWPNDTVDSLFTPTLLPSTKLTVDGVPIEVVADLAGDAPTPSNSFLWIPSLKTVLAGDIAFNGVHPWLGASTEAIRLAWRQSIKRIRELHPDKVVAGHKREIGSPDSPDVLDFMDRYLTDFDALKKTSADGRALATAMLQKYPNLAAPGLLMYSARVAFGR